MQTEKHPTFEPGLFGSTAHKSIEPVSAGATICVVGAGAFGGWTALHLLRCGYKVTLIDSWGAGNARSSSGDDTRVTRSTYGRNELYFKMNVRSLEIWAAHERTFSKKIFYNTGVLWFCYSATTPIVDDSIPFAEKYGVDYEYLKPSQIRDRFPEVNATDLHHAWYDPHGGYLKAREACEEVKNCFIREGGTYLEHRVQPGTIERERMRQIVLENGNSLQADAFIFACGAWLPAMFPGQLGSVILPTRQEVYYFGVPQVRATNFDSMPAWIDADGTNFYYGIAGNSGRGFKIGVDIRGKPFEPTGGDRLPEAEVLAGARNFLTHRFPRMRDAPLLESRVCPYENSTSGNFIFDQLPGTGNAFILGGGSGHGFKHGPAMGEIVAQTLAGTGQIPDLFRLVLE